MITIEIKVITIMSIPPLFCYECLYKLTKHFSSLPSVILFSSNIKCIKDS